MSAFLFSLISSTPHVDGNTPTLQNNSCPFPHFGTCFLLCLKHFFSSYFITWQIPSHPSNLIPYNLSFWEPAWVEGLLLGSHNSWVFVTELITQTSIYLVTFQTPTLDWELRKDRNHVFFVLVWHLIYGCLIIVC